jgi:hypothetical protein
LALAGMAVYAAGGMVRVDCTAMALVLSWASLTTARVHRDDFRALGPEDAESARATARRVRRQRLWIGVAVGIGVLAVGLGLLQDIRRATAREARVRQTGASSTWRPAHEASPPAFQLHPARRTVGARSGTVSGRTWAMSTLTLAGVRGEWKSAMALVAGGPNATARDAVECRVYDAAAAPAGDGSVRIRLVIVGNPALPHLEIDAIERVTAVVRVAADGTESPWNAWVLTGKTLAIRAPAGAATLEIRAEPTRD